MVNHPALWCHVRCHKFFEAAANPCAGGIKRAIATWLLWYQLEGSFIGPTANTKLGSPYLVGDDSPNPKHSISRKPWARDPKIDSGSGFRADSRFDVGSCITVDLYQRAPLTYELSDVFSPKIHWFWVLNIFDAPGDGIWGHGPSSCNYFSVMSISYQPLSSDSKSDTSDRLSFILQSIIPGIFISGIRDLKPAVGMCQVGGHGFVGKKTEMNPGESSCSVCWNCHLRVVPSGKHTKSYWKWP